MPAARRWLGRLAQPAVQLEQAKASIATPDKPAAKVQPWTQANGAVIVRSMVMRSLYPPSCGRSGRARSAVAANA